MRHDLKSDAHQKVGRAQAMSGEAVIRSVSDEALRRGVKPTAQGKGCCIGPLREETCNERGSGSKPTRE